MLPAFGVAKVPAELKTLITAPAIALPGSPKKPFLGEHSAVNVELRLGVQSEEIKTCEQLV